MMCARRVALAFLSLMPPAAALAQPATPDPFLVISRDWTEMDGNVQVMCKVLVDEETGSTRLFKLRMDGSGQPLNKEGRLTDPAIRDRLRLAAGMVKGLADIDAIGDTSPKHSYMFRLSDGKAKFFNVDPNANLQWKRVVDAGLNQLVTQLLASGQAPAFDSLQWLHDEADGKWATTSIQLHGDGKAEARVQAGGATRILEGRATEAELDAVRAALVPAALDTQPLMSQATAPFPRSRLRFSVNQTEGTDIVVALPTPARLQPLHAALEAIATRLRSAPVPAGWEEISRGGAPDWRTLELSQRFGIRYGMGDWKAPTAQETQAIDAAMAQIDLATLAASPINAATYFDIKLKDGSVRRVSRNRDAAGRLVSPNGSPEPGLVALDEAITRITTRLNTTASAVPAGQPRRGISEALGD